jgi:hypothetical protein
MSPETCKTKIGRVQINNNISGQNSLSYATGLLRTHHQFFLKGLNVLKFLLLTHKKLPVKKEAEKLYRPSVIFLARVFGIFTFHLKL